MNLEKASHYVQIVSGVVLIAGVGLIVVELQQTRRLAEAQLESDSWDSVFNRGIAQMGERAPSAIAKACSGDALSKEDAVVLASRFGVLISHVGRQMEVERLAGFESERWRTRARDSFMIIFATDEGRSWWRSSRDTYLALAPEMVPIGDGFLEELGPPDCKLSAILEPGA